jgi:2-oxoglutarate ferredoxin oxidoreductase subunit delta
MESKRQKSKTGKKGSASQPAQKPNAEAGNSKRGRKRYEIDIFRDWCKSCGICAAFCPRECIALDDEGVPSPVDSERCTGCGWCELHCPDFAISVHLRDGEQ